MGLSRNPLIYLLIDYAKHWLTYSSTPFYSFINFIPEWASRQPWRSGALQFGILEICVSIYTRLAKLKTYTRIWRMQMAQHMESNKKQMMVEFRKLVLKIEEELVRIRQAFSKYPVHSAISFDLLCHLFGRPSQYSSVSKLWSFPHTQQQSW